MGIEPFNHHGAECDLVLVNGINIEIKYSLSPVISKGFYAVIDDLKLPEAWIIMPRVNPAKIHENVNSSNFIEFYRGGCGSYK